MNKKTNFKTANTNLTWKDLYQQYSEKLSKNIQKLKIILKRWAQLKKAQVQIPQSQEEVLEKYLLVWNNYNNEYRMREHYSKFQLHYQNIDRPETQQDVYINYPLLGKAKWNLIIEDKCLDCKSLKHLMTKIYIYISGYIPINQKNEGNYLKKLKGSRFNKSSYYQETQGKYSFVLNIGVQKIPCFQVNSKKMIAFQFVPYIALLGKSKNQKNLQFIKKIEQQWKKDPRKNFENKFPIQDKEQLNPKFKYFQTQECLDLDNKIIQKCPMIYKSIKSTEQSTEEYIFKLKNLYSDNDAEQNNETEINSQMLQTNQVKYQILNQDNQQEWTKQKLNQKNLFQFKSAKALITLLQTIPNFKFNLTGPEKDVVGKEGNIIVIGRSGTGKTTCALVRLFAIQILFKQNTLKQKIKNKQIEKKGFEAEDIEKVFGLKNVFLTASSSLIVQIKKQYQDMIDHLKQQLKMHKDKKIKKIINTLKEENVFQELQNSNKQNQDIQKIQQNIKDEQKKMLSLKNLEGKDFPAFYTIKDFIIMLDGVLDKPFFTRIQEQNKKQQQDQDEQKNLGWNQEKDESSKFKIQVRRSTNQNKKKFKKLAEITYDSFVDQFWECLPKVFLKDAQLSPPIIWSEIYSIIKGSVKAHTFNCKYLSQADYLKQSNNKFYQTNDKKVIYKIFEYYESWKKDTYHYDFMDVVNNCLHQIQTNGYKGPAINYLFIDEVQDLTPATIYLLSKIVTDGVFYSGDTAQAIVKGVSFRFSDIKTMYHEKFQLQKLPNGKPNQTQLTVNFRSHNQILQLANTVVSSIQILFPKTIDSLKKQTSSLNGPKPFVISSRKQVDIFKLLCQFNEQVYQNAQEQWNIKAQIIQSQSSKNRTIFNSQQIIIVRNIEEKKKLPPCLRNGIVLTIEQAKGLQFQDVILYNFFQSCKCRDKWKLIQYLLIEQDLVQKETYESSISRVQATLNLEPQSFDVQLQRIKLGNDQFYKVKKLKIDPKILGIDKNKYIQLLTQLKTLYTIITRAKISFLIFDSKIPESLFKIWKQLKVIKEVEDYKQQNQKIFQYKEKIRVKKFVNSQQAWRDQGFKLYNRKNYDEAIKCYQMAKDYQTAKNIKAQKFANQALVENQRYNNQLTNPKKLSNDEFKILSMNLKSQKPFILSKFAQAGKLFLQIKKFKNAGQCYISAQKYLDSLICFERCEFVEGIALSCLKLQKYQSAAQNYQKIKNFQKMLECYLAGSLWNMGLKKLFQYEGFIENSQFYCRTLAKNALKAQLKNLKLKRKKNQPYEQEQNNVYQVYDYSQSIQTFISEFRDNFYKNKINQILNEIQKIYKKEALLRQITSVINKKQKQIIEYEELNYICNPQKLIELQKLRQEIQQFIYMQSSLEESIQNFKKKYNSILQCKKKAQNLTDYLDFYENKPKQNQKYISQQRAIPTMEQYQKQYSLMSKQETQSRFQQFWQNQNYQLQSNYNVQQSFDVDNEDNLQVYSVCEFQCQEQQQFLVQQLIFKDKVMQIKSKKQLLEFCRNISTLQKRLQNSYSQKNVESIKQLNQAREIDQFLNTIDTHCLRRQIQKTLIFKEPMVNIICEGLILQGSYINALKYLEVEQYCNLTYKFSNYQKFMSKIKQTTEYNKLKYDYIIVEQTNRKNLLAKLVNTFSMQQIFWIYDSLQQSPFLSKTNWTTTVQLSQEDFKIIFQKLKQFSKQQHGYLSQLNTNLQQLKRNKDYFPKKHLQQQHQKIQKVKLLLIQFKNNDKALKQSRMLSNTALEQANLIFCEKNQLLQILTNIKKAQQQLQNAILTQQFQLKYKQTKSKQYKIQEQKIQNNIIQHKNKLLDKDKLSQYLHQQKCKLNTQKWRIQDQLNFFESLRQRQQKQIKDCYIQIDSLQKQIQRKQAQIQKQKQTFRKTLVQERKNELIKYKKQQFQQNAMLKLKQKTHIPSENDKFLFTKQFFAGFQKKIANAQSNSYLQMIQRISFNANKAIDNMEDFMICQLLIFYLSMINYEKYNEDVVSYISRMEYQRKQYQKRIHYGNRMQNQQKQLIKRYEIYVKDLKQIKEKRTLSGQQTKNLYQIQSKIRQLKNNIVQTQLIEKFFLMIEKIYKKTKIISNQHQLHFIEILMGFFQCRLVKNCPSLWMVQNQYVIVKSSSMIISEAIKQKMFCYFFDNDQETVLMRFQDSFGLIKAFITQKHKGFIKKYHHMIFKVIDIQQGKLKNQFIAREGMGIKNKNLNLNEECYKYLKLQPNAQVNFNIFLQNQIPINLIDHKNNLLIFYFENGHKNHECFHLVFHQLRQMDQMKKIFNSLNYFDNEMMTHMKRKLQNLKEHLNKWEKVANQRNLLVNTKKV